MTDTTSHWISSGSLARFPKLGRDLTVDVAIVGGGITGITTAYLCAKAGLSFALIERDRLGRVDTGHTSAHLTSVTDRRLFEIVARIGRQSARAIWDGGTQAINQIVNHIRIDDIPCDFKWLPGWLHTPSSDPESSLVDELLKESAAAHDLDIPADFTPCTPIFQGPGIKFLHQAIFHPRKYLAGLIRSFGGKGTHVFEQTIVDEIQDKPLAVKAGNFTIQCAHAVVAAPVSLKGKAGALAALRLETRLKPYTSYVLSAQVPAQGVEGLFWDMNEPYYYLRLEQRRGHDLAIFGGEDHKTGLKRNASAAGQRLADRVSSIFPAAKLSRQWSGQIIETDDGLPYIGSASVNQFIATGFSGNGMTLGTLGAIMAVDSICARLNPWTEIFNVHRKKTSLPFAPDNRRTAPIRPTEGTAKQPGVHAVANSG